MAERSRLVRAFLSGGRARFALAVLGALSAASIYAPFLANDRPYRLVAIDRGAYERARSELVPLAESYQEIALLSDEEWAARGDVRPRADALRAELAALRARVGILRDHLGVEDLRRLDFILKILDGRSSELWDGFPKPLVVKHARMVAAELAPRGAGPSGAGIEVQPRTTFPLFASLEPLDVALALFVPLALAAWLARKRLQLARGLAFAAALATLAAALIDSATPARLVPAPGAIQRGIAEGTIDVRSALWPPIAMGYATTSLAESWRPPTWLASSAMDAEGRYLSGPRASAVPAGKPAVRAGERALDHPLRHPLGTDALGRDLLARCLWGGRASLAVGFAAALLLTIAGTLLGAAAGYLGGRIDAAISRAIEIVQCFPALLLVLCAIAWVDPERVPASVAVALVIAAVGWTSSARLVRAEALRIGTLEFVLAARALGLSRARILVAHVLPNALGPALVGFAFAAGSAIVIESSLAYLGLGVQVPVPSWGALVGEAHSAEHGWMWVAPGLLVFLAVLAWILLAESLRAALEGREAGT